LLIHKAEKSLAFVMGCRERRLFDMIRKKAIFTLVWTLFLLHSCKSREEPFQTGLASFYSEAFEGKITASGSVFTNSKLTAAHLTLPYGTRVRVSNLKNKKEVEVRITDRGPYIEGRIIDLSQAAAQQLGFIDEGVAEVALFILDAESLK
jgi:rare lipoprotein A